MMKKNLFLLVSFYFFVLQTVFIGLLRGNSNFYRLAVINFIFIALIGFFSKEGSGKIKTIENENSVYLEKEKVKKIQKTKIYKPIPHIWLFVIAILFGFFVWFWFGGMILSLQMLISVLGSFVLFILFGFLFKFSIKKVRETKVYILVLIGLFIWSGIMLLDFSKINFDFLNISNYFENNENTQDIEIDIMSQSGKLTELDANTGFDASFVSVDEDGIVTGSVSDLILSSVEENTLSKEELEKPATFADVIKSLIDQNDIVLNTTQNIKFNYVISSSEDYAYYRTAYDKKLIGKTVNPTKTLLCETYIVMKGLVDGRDVGSYRDIKKAYWDYAKNNNNLSTCEYGSYVKIGDLD